MKPILGKGGRLLGYLRESGDRIELIEPGGRLLGIYIRNDNMTIRPGGAFEGYGNVLLTLLHDP